MLTTGSSRFEKYRYWKVAVFTVWLMFEGAYLLRPMDMPEPVVFRRADAAQSRQTDHFHRVSPIVLPWSIICLPGRIQLHSGIIVANWIHENPEVPEMDN